MQKTSKYYWWLQIGGWGALALILILINILFGRVDQQFLICPLIESLTGIFTTHLFRILFCQQWLAAIPVEKALSRLALGHIDCLFTGYHDPDFYD